MSKRGPSNELLAPRISLKKTRLASGFFQKDHHQDPHEAENILVLVAVVKFFNMEHVTKKAGRFFDPKKPPLRRLSAGRMG